MKKNNYVQQLWADNPVFIVWKKIPLSMKLLFVFCFCFVGLLCANDSYYNPQIQISAESGTKRSIFRQKNKTKRSKKRLHTTLIKPEQKVNEDLCSGFIVS